MGGGGPASQELAAMKRASRGEGGKRKATKPQGTKRKAAAEDDLWMPDVLTFLALYDKAKSLMLDSFNQLFQTQSPQSVTTTIGHLERIIEFLFVGQPTLKPKDKGPGFEVLFAP